MHVRSAILPFALFLASASAFAWPGTVSVECKSLPGAKNKVALFVSRTGTPTPDFPAEVDLSINDQQVKLDDPDRTAIAIVFQPGDQVITTAFAERNKQRDIDLTIWSKPGTIKGGQSEECREDYQFRAGFGGSLTFFGTKPDDYRSASDYDGDVLDCTYYSSPGSAGC